MNNVGPVLAERHQPRLARLDHIRALAAFMVLCWHTVGVRAGGSFPALYIFREGYTGVSLFCVASGFIFAYLYFGKDIIYGEFIKRRAMRIIPMMLLLLITAYYTTPMSLYDLVSILTTTIKFGQQLTAIVGQQWSLLIEIQFYLLFPFLILFGRTRGLKYLVAALLFVLGFRFVLFINRGVIQDLSYWTMFGRLDQFLAGMIAGVILRQTMPLSDRARMWATTCGVFAALTILCYFWWFNVKFGGYLGDFGQPWSGKHRIWVFMPALEGVCYATVIFGYITTHVHFQNVIARWAGRVLAYLGKISYSIYINQFLVLIFITHLPFHWSPPATWNQGALKTTFIIFPILILCSTVTYYIIEEPFMSIRARTKDIVKSKETPTHS